MSSSNSYSQQQTQKQNITRGKLNVRTCETKQKQGGNNSTMQRRVSLGEEGSGRIVEKHMGIGHPHVHLVTLMYKSWIQVWVFYVYIQVQHYTHRGKRKDKHSRSWHKGFPMFRVPILEGVLVAGEVPEHLWSTVKVLLSRTLKSQMLRYYVMLLCFSFLDGTAQTLSVTSCPNMLFIWQKR